MMGNSRIAESSLTLWLLVYQKIRSVTDFALTAKDLFGALGKSYTRYHCISPSDLESLHAYPAALASYRWGGSQIVRFAKNGTIDLVVRFPTALNITACCFGGRKILWCVDRI